MSSLNAHFNEAFMTFLWFHFRFACCFKVRKNVAETKLNALLSNRKVYFLKGRPSHESLVLCVKYETLYKAQYIFQGKMTVHCDTDANQLKMSVADY